LSPPLEARQAPAPAPAPLAARLPRGTMFMYGREDDLARLAAALHERRFVTLTGIGGVGKSHLAQHLLHERASAYEQGAVWVELAQLFAPELVIDTVAAGVGIAVGGIDPLGDLVAGLRGRELLLGIDNAEHLADEVARVVGAIAAGAPRVTLLVTSQAPLRLPREHVLRLAPLALPPADASVAQAMRHGAVELFVRRAQETDMRFSLQAHNVAAVIDICRRVDGLPLALELAAARTPLLRLAGLTAMLSDPLRLLTATTKRPHDPRHRALRITLEWSHDLLGPREKKAFRRLAAFVGSCSLALACEVLRDAAPEPRGDPAEGIPDTWAALEALNELTERSLVEADESDPPRYRLLETSRAFANERLEAAGESEAMRGRHARAVAASFAAIDEAIASGELTRDHAVDQVWPDIANARAAIEWSLVNEPPLALTIVPVIEDLFKSILFPDVRRMWNATLPLLDDRLPPRLRARWALGYAHFWTNRDLALTLEWSGIAYDLYSRDDSGADNLPRTLRALYLRVTATARSGGDTTADLARLRAIDCSRRPVAMRYLQVFAEGVLHALKGNFPEALAYYGRALPLAQMVGDRELYFALMLNTIDMEIAIGRLDDAIRKGQELVAGLRGTRFLELTTIALNNLAAALIAKGSLAEARQVIEQGLPMADDHSLTAEWADHLAWFSAQEGRYYDAAHLLGYGDLRYEQRGSIRSNIEANAARQAEALARQAFGDAAFESERAFGRTLPD
ncbi:MAG TPA: hypothetical protein VF453_12885, partial [Burkholderiaceae bacterium]